MENKILEYLDDLCRKANLVPKKYSSDSSCETGQQSEQTYTNQLNTSEEDSAYFGSEIELPSSTSSISSPDKINCNFFFFYLIFIFRYYFIKKVSLKSIIISTAS